MERQISETELGLLRNDKRAHLKTIKGGFQDTHLAAGTIDKSISSSRVGRFWRWKSCKVGTNFLGFRIRLTREVRSTLLYFQNDEVYILNLIYWIIFSFKFVAFAFSWLLFFDILIDIDCFFAVFALLKFDGQKILYESFCLY